MIYRHEFRGQTYSTTVTGLPNPRWALESFTLEQGLRQQWWHVEPGQVVIDAGAGFGSYTLPALACGAWVFAFEPDKETFFALCQNLALNPEYVHRARALNCVLCDAHGIVMGYDHVSHSSTSHAVTGALEHRLGRSVDGLAQDYQLTRLDWLKIDVEGGEVQVLAGAVQSIKRLRPKILIENHLDLNPKVKDQVMRLLSPLNYRITKSEKGEGGNDDWNLWEPNA